MSDSDVTIIGSQTDCPHCGALSEIIPGRYDSFGGRLNLLLDPSISPEALDLLRKLTERLQRNEISPEQAKEEADKISPKAGKLFDIADWSDSAKATLYASIIGAVALVAAAKLSAPTTQEVHVQPVIERSVKQYRDSTAIGGVPIPTPRPKEPPKERP